MNIKYRPIMRLTVAGLTPFAHWRFKHRLLLGQMLMRLLTAKLPSAINWKQTTL